MKRILCVVVLMLFLSGPFTMLVSAGNEEEPEIIDEVNDNELPFLDIISAWFHEEPEEPEYLYTTMKLISLNTKFNSVLSIRWSLNNKEYVAGLDIYKIRGIVFRSGDPQRATYWQWNEMPECEGFINQKEQTITWKIPKTTIGDLKQGDVLQNTRAGAIPGFPLSFLYFFLGRQLKDFAPDSTEFGNEYIIKY